MGAEEDKHKSRITQHNNACSLWKVARKARTIYVGHIYKFNMGQTYNNMFLTDKTGNTRETEHHTAVIIVNQSICI